jgi:DNA-binding protein HU-beta
MLSLPLTARPSAGPQRRALGGAVNKAQLIEQLSDRFGGKRQAAEALDSVLDAIQRTVTAGEKVVITGFGVFERVDRPARTARNPATGERVRVKKTSVPKFRPGSDFKSFVSGAKKLPKAAASAAKKATTAASDGAAGGAPAKTSARKASTTAKTSTAKTTGAQKTSATKKSSAAKTSAAKSTAKKTTPSNTAAKKTSGAAKTTKRAAKRA